MQVLDLVGFICIQVSKFGHNGRGEFFSSVSMTGFWFTGIMFLLYLFQVVYKATRIPWLQIEMWFCAIITLCFLLASSLAADMGTGAFIAAAVSSIISIVYWYVSINHTFYSHSFSVFAQCVRMATMHFSSTGSCKAQPLSCSELPSYQRHKWPNSLKRAPCGIYSFKSCYPFYYIFAKDLNNSNTLTNVFSIFLQVCVPENSSPSAHIYILIW